jgi:dTDP-4-amino-4,6-dideoxygalactose transaminase
MNAFKIVADFEKVLCDYTHSPFAVAVDSNTMALFLAFAYYKKMGGTKAIIPFKTYPSVPMSAFHAGLEIEYSPILWNGCYEIKPSSIWDCAKRFTSSMYKMGEIQCLSFHGRKLLPIGNGGAILHSDPLADEWYRRARFDGRKEGIDTKYDDYSFPGWHCYMTPEIAARGIYLMMFYPKDVLDQSMDDYPDMSKWKWSR